MERKIVWLEVMRGFAALWVLVHHAELTTNAFFGEIGSKLIASGYLGVDFFFILSGFIITYSSSRMIESGRGFGEFFSLRLTRIYAAYLPIGVALYVGYQLLPGLSAGDREIGTITSLTLFPTSLPPALSVAWTLQNELLFYTLFSTLFISKRLCVLILAVWLAFILLTMQLDVVYGSGVMKVFSNPLNLWFFVGIGIYFVKDFSLNSAVFWLAIAGAAVLIAVLVVTGQGRLFVGCAMALMVLLFSKTKNIAVNPHSILLYLGSASYSVYLVHNPVQSVVARLIPAAGINVGTWGAFLIIAFGSLIAGLVYYAVFEKHATAFCRKYFKAHFASKATVGADGARGGSASR